MEDAPASETPRTRSHQHDNTGPPTAPPGPTAVVPFRGGGAAMPSISRRTVRKLSDVVNRRSNGSRDGEEPTEEEIQTLDMDYVVLGDVTEEQLDQTRILDVQDLVTESIDAGGAKISVRDVVAYVVLKFDPEVDNDWTVPEPSLYHDLICRVDSRIQSKKLRCAKAYKWGNLWGNVGLLGLCPADTTLLNEYRQVIEAQILGRTRFTIFPKDGLEKRGNLTVLLRENFREYLPECLPRAILMGSRRLKGGLKVTHVRTYPDRARSRAGASKRGWRLLMLQGLSLIHI